MWFFDIAENRFKSCRYLSVSKPHWKRLSFSSLRKSPWWLKMYKCSWLFRINKTLLTILSLFSGFIADTFLTINTHGKWVCLQCGKEFSIKHNAVRHFRDIHMENKRIECEICKQEFKNKNSLSTHIKNRHKISKREKQADVTQSS